MLLWQLTTFFFLESFDAKKYETVQRVKDTSKFISSGLKIVKRLRRRQYDPLIIERTIGLVLGPSIALYRAFLKHCYLTNKTMGTIWQALSKPPQRRQGPDLRPLWMLVGTPLAIRPELAWRRTEHSLSYSDITIYIVWYIILITHAVCVLILRPLYFVWLLFCCLYKEFLYKIFNVCPFDYTYAAGSGKVNHTSWISMVTPTKRPKSVPYRCVIEFVVAHFLCCYFARLTFLLV